MHLILLRLTQALYWPQLRNQLWYQKERVQWKQTTHTPTDTDPDIDVLQIELTPANNLPCPPLRVSHCPPWLLNNSQTVKHIHTATRQLTTPIMHFHTYAISKGKFDSHSQKTCTSSTARAILAISSSRKLKEMVGSFSESSLRSL
jgi:hypothetical protein